MVKSACAAAAVVAVTRSAAKTGSSHTRLQPCRQQHSARAQESRRDFGKREHKAPKRTAAGNRGRHSSNYKRARPVAKAQQQAGADSRAITSLSLLQKLQAAAARGARRQQQDQGEGIEAATAAVIPSLSRGSSSRAQEQQQQQQHSRANKVGHEQATSTLRTRFPEQSSGGVGGFGEGLIFFLSRYRKILRIFLQECS